MSCLIEAVIPEMSLKPLTYLSEKNLIPGTRIIVEVQKKLHAGIVLGLMKKKMLSRKFEIKSVQGIIDDKLMFDYDLWDLALWSSKVCMCGINNALRAVFPKNFYMGEKLEPPPKLINHHNKFTEINNFNPFDNQRVNFYLDELDSDKRTLMLFPTKESAKNFYDLIPQKLKHDCLLWPFVRDWEIWKQVNAKKYRIVIGAPGAVFAPLSPERIIVEDEGNSAYFLPHNLKISARSLAGRRALFLGAEFILGGRIPSLKTYMRTKIKEIHKPSRKNIILADIYSSKKTQAKGIEGNIPLTFSLVRRTYSELINGKNVMWILNRTGESQEVYCDKCGHTIKCKNCGQVMRAVNDGELLKCKFCGQLMDLPEKCEECGHNFFIGRRPGIEALAKIVSNYYPKVKLYVKGSRKNSLKGLIITTNRGLDVLDSVKPSLIAWIDFDSEIMSNDYGSRYHVFRMLYKSLYAGINNENERKILIQARKSGMNTARLLFNGYEKFFDEELRMRREFMLPPCGYMVEVDSGSTITREKIMKECEDNGIFVMYSGNDDEPLYVNVEKLEVIMGILEPLSGINITVRSE